MFFFSVSNRWQAPFSAGVRLPKNRKCWGNKKMIIMWWYSKFASLPNVSWAVLFNIIPLLFGYNEKNWNNYAINMMTVFEYPGLQYSWVEAFQDLPNLFAHLIRKSRKPLSIYERLGYPFWCEMHRFTNGIDFIDLEWNYQPYLKIYENICKTLKNISIYIYLYIYLYI